MASGDFIYRQPRTGTFGAAIYNVAAGTPIYAGDPVQVVTLSTPTVVVPALTNTPDASAHLYVGIAATNSTNTATAAGFVDVFPVSSKDVILGNPDTAATWDTQAEYDALVGARVLIKNSVTVSATPTSGTYTVLATDSTNNGCVVQPLNVFKTPGKVAFCSRDSTNYLP